MVAEGRKKPRHWSSRIDANRYQKRSTIFDCWTLRNQKHDVPGDRKNTTPNKERAPSLDLIRPGREDQDGDEAADVWRNYYDVSDLYCNVKVEQPTGKQLGVNRGIAKFMNDGWQKKRITLAKSSVKYSVGERTRTCT